ncbi:MAG: hypothetical protein IT389_03400 [Nitrospira sp.]|nr:hypothetical protein [Nitrospira sp.]
MSNAKEKAMTVNVRLKPIEPLAHPLATNYANVGAAQGIAYVDFWFIEPDLLGMIAKAVKDGQTATKGIDGQLVTCVVMGVNVGCAAVK